MIKIKADNSERRVWADSGRCKSGNGFRQGNQMTRTFSKYYIE